MIQILQKDAPVLRKKAAEVPLAGIGSAKFKKILKDMEAALETQNDGVALAAPQIGVSLRIFVVSKVALSPLEKGVTHSDVRGLLSPLKKGVPDNPPAEDGSAPFIKGDSARTGVVDNPHSEDGAPPLLRGMQPPKAAPFSKGDKRAAGYLTFINPVITKLSRDKSVVDEGCLSVRPLYGKIKRAKKVVVRAYDEHGKLFERGASGLLAQIFQHECDHLDGILFIDKATDLRELPHTTNSEQDTKLRA